MALVMFYHLTRSAPAQTLRAILPRAVALGWRVMVRGTDQEKIAALDEALWNADGFLPHAISGQLNDADQPILLGQGGYDAGIKGLVLVDGAQCSVTEATALERVWILFDGDDPDAVAAARDQWRHLTAAGLGAQYWSEDSGKWVKKTEKSAG
jgi:DNA polymerase III subunit chi